MKPLHGVTVHAVLVLPGLAWVLGRSSWPADRQLTVVRGAVATYTVLIVAVAVSLA